jgi:hypothetical protein
MLTKAIWIALLPLAAHAFAPQTGWSFPVLGGRPALWCGGATCAHPAAAAATGAASLHAQLKLPSQIDWEERGGGGGTGGAGRGSREYGQAIRLRGAERRYRRMQR